MKPSEAISELAKQAEVLLEEGIAEADRLFIKTTDIRTQIDQFRWKVSEQLAKQNSSSHFHH